MKGSIFRVSKLGKWREYLILFVFLFATACGSEKYPDVGDIKIRYRAERFDKALTEIDTDRVAADLSALKQRFPVFLDFYLDTLMGFGIKGNYMPANPGIAEGLKPFLQHEDIRGLFDTVLAHFPETQKIDAELQQGFRYMKHYFPSFQEPTIIYMISGLNKWSAVSVDDQIIGVGLDMYLGSQYPFYRSVGIPEYMILKCRPEYIPAHVFQVIHRRRYPFEVENRTLLDMMIQRGKEQYFLARVLPKTPDSIRLGFTADQLAWCQESEAGIYNFFIKEGLLYENRLQKVYRYVNDGPFATGMPPESPGNVGTWLGYRIVQKYMDKHPGKSMEDLFAQNNAQQILQESEYKPR